jgi:hypothetical protein
MGGSRQDHDGERDGKREDFGPRDSSESAAQLDVNAGRDCYSHGTARMRLTSVTTY